MGKHNKRANPPICWLCDRPLAGGGYQYTVIVEDGHEHPAHVDCARSPGLSDEKRREDAAREGD